MLLTKGELNLGLVEEGIANMIVCTLTGRFGTPTKRAALASGYVRKGYRYLAKYNGRFGCGITVRYHNSISTRYCDKDTLIFDATAEEINEIIEYCFRKAGIEKGWKVMF